MHTRTSERKSINLPIKIHFFGEQVDMSESADISDGGFFVRTESVSSLDKGVVALVSISPDSEVQTQHLAEVVRITELGIGFKIIEANLEVA